MEAEEDRKRKEAEEIERQAMLEKERNFDQVGELRRLGGKVYDFYAEDGKPKYINNILRN